MVALLSVGITTYMNDKEFSDIPCAYEDAKKVYKALGDVTGKEFKHCCSTCLKDIMTSELRCLLPLLPMTLEPDDIFIFYFSGHGSRDVNGRLKLVFSDAARTGLRGEIELSEIISLLSQAPCNIILILDCCYSGAGLCEINQNNQYMEKRISMLVSSGAIGSSEYNQDGSDFTEYLTEALYQLYNRQERITLNSIHEYIRNRYSKNYASVGGGEVNVNIGRETDYSMDDRFLNKFIYKIHTYNFELREAMWYSLVDLPDKQKIHVLEQFMESNKGHAIDMSWRVRRAVGSLISSIYETDKRKDIVYKLIESKIWMERCIGYIGGRKNPDPYVLGKMETDALNKENPMDLIWLSSLYLSDWNKEDYRIKILKGNLAETAWGVIEIWKHFFKEDTLDETLAIFKEQVKDEEYRQLCLYLYFKGYDVSIDKKEYDSSLWKYEGQIKELYKSQTRGRTAGKVNKWIWSILNGNWRDQINLKDEIAGYMEIHTEQKNREFLEALRYTPCVEIKMGIMDYFSSDSGKDICSRYKNELIWGIEDQHPWVVRAALPIYRNDNETVQGQIKNNIDRCLYPGVFDLLIELKRQELSSIRYHAMDFSAVEVCALESAISSE